MLKLKGISGSLPGSGCRQSLLALNMEIKKSSNMQKNIWHQKQAEEVFREIGSAAEGVRHEEARARLLKHGPNELIEKKKKSPLMMLLDQFKDFMIIVLMVAAVISGVIGELSDTLAIIVIVLINAVIGFVQEYRAEKAMEALKKMVAASAVVLRDGVPATLFRQGLFSNRPLLGPLP